MPPKNSFFDDYAEEDEEDDESFNPDEKSVDNDDGKNDEKDEREIDYKNRLKEEDEENYLAKKYSNYDDIIDNDEDDFEEGNYNMPDAEQTDDLDNEYGRTLIEMYQKPQSQNTNNELFFDLKDFDIYELKLMNLAFYQNQAYNNSSYQKEEPIKFIDEKGRQIVKKIPYENYIRWKNIDKPQDQLDINEDLDKRINDFFAYEKKDESCVVGNTHLIEFDDGSYKIKIGENLYDIVIANSSNMAVSVKESSNDTNNSEVFLGNIRNKFIIKKSYEDLFDRRKSSMSYEDFKKPTSTNMLGKDDSGVKTKKVHSFFDKNKFSREEYTAKPGMTNSLKKIEKLYKKNFPQNNTGVTQTGEMSMLEKKMLARKRKNYDDDYLDDE